jgi:hypothetical protein
MNRWIIVIGGILIQLALGAIYAWSAFTTLLQGTLATLVNLHSQRQKHRQSLALDF